MVRLVRAVTIVMVLGFGTALSNAQPSVEATITQVAVEESARLNEQVEKLLTEGRYQDAITPAMRALALREKVRGSKHPDVAESLNNLGAIYYFQGAYAKAETCLIRALAIHEEVSGANAPDVADDLNNLAMLYQVQSEYSKAEPLHLRALRIYEKAFGSNHSSVASELHNLANLYWWQGAYTEAQRLYIRAADIREKALGPEHPDFASSLNGLASIYWVRGEYDKAEPLYLRALAIYSKSIGPNHPFFASELHNLANLYQAQNAYGKAEPFLIRALDIHEKALGPDHPDVATDLNNLATLYRDQGAYARAEPLHLRALRIYERALGSNHPDVASSVNDLALLNWAQGSHALAQSLLARAATIREQQLHTELPWLPEPRKRALMTLLQRDTDSVISFHVNAASESKTALELALTTILRRKGRILDSLADGDPRIRQNLVPRFRNLHQQLAQMRADLVAHLYAPAGQRTSSDRAAADAIRLQIEEVETKLSKASAEFRVGVESVDLTKVRTQIPAKAILIEFVKYRFLDPKQPKFAKQQKERYIAYLLTARGAFQWVPLGEAASIDAQVDVVLAAIRTNAPVDTTRAALQRLDALVLAPVRTKLPGVSHLILAPDGQLNLVPFEVLVDPQGHYALENYLISYVTTGRDLLRIAAPRSPKSPAVIVADPDYGPLRSPEQGTISVTPLPDAQAEAADLQLYFPSAPITGANATKAALASLTAPAIIHIATHGFYARNVPSGRPAPGVLREMARGFYVDDEASSPGSSSRSDDLADGLDRAGLALAGANQGPQGIVTAREIAGFDWWGTQLVVLSACETGFGAASSGDGVYGLRRALVLAGAASQVVSLWNVEDASTRQLMREFYGNLARGIGRAEALRRAKLHLLHQPQYEHPFYWAPFIAAGDWRPLPKGILVPQKATP